MNILKKIFCLDDTSAIGLCKFNDYDYQVSLSREQIKKRIKKDTNLTQMLKRSL